MSSLAIFNNLMKHDIVLRKKIRDVSGNYSTDTETNLKGFVEFDSRFKFSKNEEFLEAKAIVYLKNDCGIDENHEYYEIDQTAPKIVNNMTVLDIARIDDPITNTTHHYELIVK